MYLALEVRKDKNQLRIPLSVSHSEVTTVADVLARVIAEQGRALVAELAADYDGRLDRVRFGLQLSVQVSEVSGD